MINTTQLLSAIQTALTGDATLTAIVPAANIGNHLKDETTFPHILYGLEAENAGIKGQTAYVMTLVLDAWSDYRGEKQVWEIHNAIADILDRTPLTIASGTNTYLHFDAIQVDTEGDGRTRHGTITYSLMLTE
jgi:hypothetical protein